MELLPIERETIITTSDDDKSKWHIYSRQIELINYLTEEGRNPFNVKRSKNGEVYSAEFEIEYDSLYFK